ncbi:MAG TPA: hypothetical protein VIP11_14055, partial [Gemmatimonadaceae bacterium]
YGAVTVAPRSLLHRATKYACPAWRVMRRSQIASLQLGTASTAEVNPTEKNAGGHRPAKEA